VIERIIEACARNRFLVLVTTTLLAAAGLWSISRVPLDALPDISDVQVIIYTQWMGRSPDLVEDQVTYPIVSALISAPHVRTVRGVSDFGFSYVYVIFEDGTDLYWARSRVLEYLQQIGGSLPDGAHPALGPDATGLGWVYQYALVDSTGTYDLVQLRTMQDWYLKYGLASVEGVAEVASVGGFVKEYQVQVDPVRLAAYGITLGTLSQRIKDNNNEVEGRVIEQSGREFMVRGRGYLKSVADIEGIALSSTQNGTPVYVRDVASVSLGPAMRRGVVELNGEGEVVGGVVVMRDGENALNVIERVKERLHALSRSLPKEVKIVPTYDRSELINASVGTLRGTLIEQIIVVSLITIIFLLHLRSALVPIIALPIAAIISFIPMYWLGISSNIMSLGGIALSIGEVVDASLVMVDNAHRRLSEGTDAEKNDAFGTVVRAAKQVGRPIFFSLIIIVIAFVPVFLLQAQEGRLFRPLAFAKTFAMIASTLLAITLVPVLMTLFITGKRLRTESKNPVSRFFTKLYRPIINLVLRFPWTALLINLAVIPATIPLFRSIGSEFMPPLYEGTIMYMPVTNPGISITEASRLLQAQDKILKSFPEVERVFGKTGKAETSTDPAPLSMMETVITLKPKETWRKGLTYERLIAEMDSAVRFPGVQNAWTQPIRGRIDMLTTGIRTPVGIKIGGASLDSIEQIGKQIENLLKAVPGTRSVYAERVTGGYFVDIVPRRDQIARYGLSVGDVQRVIQAALGGEVVTQTVEGRERYPVTVRYFRELRDDIEQIKRILVPINTVPAGAPPSNQTASAASGMGTMGGAAPPSAMAATTQSGSLPHVPLEQLADISMVSGPGMIRDEDGLLSGYVFIDVTDRDIGGYVDEAKTILAQGVSLPAGYTLGWSGQYEFQLRARRTLAFVLPIVVLVVFILLYMTFHSAVEAGMVMLAVVYAMTGGLILQWALGYQFSVAVWVGYIALYGVAVETGVLMVVYLQEALAKRQSAGPVGVEEVRLATIEGAVLRLRPKLMTVATTLIGLIPILWSTGVGSDVMKPIAAPIVGGMVTSTIHVLVITPVIFFLLQRASVRRAERRNAEAGR
jgi:Cu(I)/Ag(I) efflux system membrane protein CusA/SilA